MGLTYNIAAKPTHYKGCEFRSRLEATWAAFFDLCGWNWEYEPLDLTGWVPDFVLRGDKDVAVEVKPVMRLSDFPHDGFTKMDKSGWTGEILILGSGVFDHYYWGSAIGWLSEERDEQDLKERTCSPRQGSFGDAVFGAFAQQPRRLDFCHDIGSYSGRMTGFYEGNPPTLDVGITRDMWRGASNLTRWMPKR
jgi:hypothetical protein